MKLSVPSQHLLHVHLQRYTHIKERKKIPFFFFFSLQLNTIVMESDLNER